jgi:hypothetical protein
VKPTITMPAAPSPGWEMLAVTLAGWAVLAAIPIALGRIGISWDALNHHIYLGWIAEHNRFDRDLLGASYQSFQFPYSYWPVYKLAYGGFSGVGAGVVIATMHATAVPALWLVANSCIPEKSWNGTALRLLAVILAFESGVIMSMSDSTSNDLLSAIPLIWSIALPLQMVGKPGTLDRKRTLIVVLSGALAGISVALKLSNGPLAVLVPLLWVFVGADWRERSRAVLWGSAAAIVAACLVYGPWAWQLWRHVGNPIYSFGDAYFEPLRRALDWHP